MRQEGRTYRHPFLILSLLPNGLPHNRYGFVTAKRLGKAVVRNRVRRLLKEAVRLLHPNLKSGFDIVLIARESAVGQPFLAVQGAVHETFQRANLLIEDIR
ncbi:MAG: hypothetical protein OHK0046_03020 [Anaerolineae bacterium]